MMKALLLNQPVSALGLSRKGRSWYSLTRKAGLNQSRWGDGMNLQELKASPDYNLHHTSWCKGYVSRKTGETEPALYKGKFGEGYTTYSPSWGSSQYCHINYYIKVR